MPKKSKQGSGSKSQSPARKFNRKPTKKLVRKKVPKKRPSKKADPEPEIVRVIGMPRADELPGVYRPKSYFRKIKIEHLMDDNQDAYQKLLECVRNGMTQWVSAEIIGISPDAITRWLYEGGKVEHDEKLTEIEREGNPYYQFLCDVRSAESQARGTAEAMVMLDKPLAWLRSGPGRARRHLPGWADAKLTLGVDKGGDDAEKLSGERPKELLYGGSSIAEENVKTAIEQAAELGLLNLNEFSRAFLPSSEDDKEAIDVTPTKDQKR